MVNAARCFKTFTMQVQYIFTFEELEQEYVNTEFTEGVDVSNLSLNDLIDHAAASLKDKEKSNLVKISCCIMGDKKDLPEWYIEANGKIWFDELEAWKNLKGIRDTTLLEY